MCRGKLVSRDILPSVTPNFFDPYFHYSVKENEQISTEICKNKAIFEGLFLKISW